MYCHQCGELLLKCHNKLHCGACNQDYELSTIKIADMKKQKN